MDQGDGFQDKFKESLNKDLKRNYQKYFEFVASLEHLKLFEWYDAQAL